MSLFKRFFKLVYFHIKPNVLLVCALLYIMSLVLVCTCNPLATVWRRPIQRLLRYSNSFWTMSHLSWARQRQDATVGPDGDGAAAAAAGGHQPLTWVAPADEVALNDLNRATVTTRSLIILILIHTLFSTCSWFAHSHSHSHSYSRCVTALGAKSAPADKLIGL